MSVSKNPQKPLRPGEDIDEVMRLGIKVTLQFESKDTGAGTILGLVMPRLPAKHELLHLRFYGNMLCPFPAGWYIVKSVNILGHTHGALQLMRMNGAKMKFLPGMEGQMFAVPAYASPLD